MLNTYCSIFSYISICTLLHDINTRESSNFMKITSALFVFLLIAISTILPICSLMGLSFICLKSTPLYHFFSPDFQHNVLFCYIRRVLIYSFQSVYRATELSKILFVVFINRGILGPDMQSM